MFITVLPMLGDYFTNQLLSGTPGTTMIGNTIEGCCSHPAPARGQGAALALLLLVVPLVPMVYYASATARASRENI